MVDCGLSTRIAKELGKPLRDDLVFLDEIFQDRYHEENVSGRIPLFTAENVLGWSMLKEKLNEISKIPLDDWTFQYTSVHGYPEVLEVLAGFVGTFIAGNEVTLDSNCFALSSGATSIIELLSWSLGDAGDVVGITAPAYPMYTTDIKTKAYLERYNIVPEIPMNSNPGIQSITLDDLIKTKSIIDEQGKNFKMIILTQPSNPDGGIISYDVLESLADWAIENKIHLIVNEIYALSSIDITRDEIKNDYTSTMCFKSFLQIIEKKQSNYLHWIYSLSKDFGISGFRVGLMYSRNKSLLDGIGIVGCPHQISNQTQWTIMNLLKDNQWVSSYTKFVQKRLTDSYILVISMLRELNIPYSTSRGSLFVWIDLSSFLPNPTFKDENELWLDIYKETKCLLTAPASFGHTKPGWIRMVITSVEVDELKEALSRLQKYFTDRKQN